MISILGRPYCQKVLPLVYSESLSYLEEVEQVRRKINEVIELFNEWQTIILELQQALTDIDDMKSDITRIDNRLTEIYSDLNGKIDELNAQYSELNSFTLELERRVTQTENTTSYLVQLISKFNADIDKKLEDLEKELRDLFNSFTADFEEELEMLQLKVNQMKVNLQGQIDELRTTVNEIDTSVINPWHWELGKINPQKNVELTYRDLADHVPLAKEYSMEGLTAQEYTNLGITALDYVTRARKLLHLDWVFSPTYGWRQEINNVLTSIVTWMSGTMTANVYAEMELDADGYSALDLTAQDYYLFKPDRVGLFVEDGVLQSQQYSLVEDDGVLKVYGGTATETDGVFSIT